MLERVNSRAFAEAPPPVRTEPIKPESTAASRTDQADIQATERLSSGIRDFLADLTQECPDIRFVFTQQDDPKKLKELAASLGQGSFVVLSNSFLQQMSKSEAAFLNGKTLIKEVVSLLRGRADKSYSHGAFLSGDKLTFWNNQASKETKKNFMQNQSQINTAFDAFQALRQGLQQQQSKTTKLFHIRLDKNSLNATRTYQKLARAGTKGEVSKVIASTNAQIAKLKAAIGSDGADDDEIRAAIAKLKHAVIRAQRKIKNLDHETLLRRQQQRAAKEAHQRKIRELEQALQRRKSSRRSRESAYIQQSILDQLLRARQQKDDMSNTAAQFCTISGTEIAAGAAAAATEIVAADIAVSASVEISL